jgi:hypothetical protein
MQGLSAAIAAREAAPPAPPTELRRELRLWDVVLFDVSAVAGVRGLVFVSTAFLLLAQAGEGLQTGYQILVDVMTIATFAPFIYIFGAAFRMGGRWAGLVGGAVTALAIVLAAIPPAGAEPWRYMAKVIGGCVVLTVFGRWLFLSSLRR